MNMGGMTKKTGPHQPKDIRWRWERGRERETVVSINIYIYIFIYLCVFAHLLHDFSLVFVWAHLGEPWWIAFKQQTLESRQQNMGRTAIKRMGRPGWVDSAWDMSCKKRNWDVSSQKKDFTSSDPRPGTLFWHSFWHHLEVYIYIWHIYIFVYSAKLSDILSRILFGIYSDIYTFWHSICHRLLTWRYSVQVQAWPSASGARSKRHAEGGGERGEES